MLSRPTRPPENRSPPIRRARRLARFCAIFLAVLVGLYTVAVLATGSNPFEGSARHGTSPTTNRPPISEAAWPGPSNTGVPKGSALSPHHGEWVVTTPGSVITNASIDGAVLIQAPDVKITDSVIRGTTDYGVFVDPSHPEASVVITDTEISGFSEGIGLNDWTCVRCNIHGVTDDGVKLGTDVLLQDSWIHDFDTSPGNHADGGQMQSGSEHLVVIHNRIDGSGPRAAMNSALFICPDLGPTSPGPVTITDNLLGGGNATLYLLDGSYGRYAQRGVSIVDNVFLNNAKFFPVDVSMSVGFEWAGNVSATDGQPVDP